MGDAKLQRAPPAVSLVQGSVADMGPPSQPEEPLQHIEFIKHLRLLSISCTANQDWWHAQPYPEELPQHFRVFALHKEAVALQHQLDLAIVAGAFSDEVLDVLGQLHLRTQRLQITGRWQQRVAMHSGTTHTLPGWEPSGGAFNHVHQASATKLCLHAEHQRPAITVH